MWWEVSILFAFPPLRWVCRYAHVMPSVPVASPPCFTCLYASHTILVVMGTLVPCFENSSIIACACFVFSNFYILCTPSLLPAFPAINTTTGTSAPAVVCEALLQLTGAPLAALYSMPVCTFWPAVLQTDLPNAGINHSGFSCSKPHPACGHLLQRRRTTDEV